MKIQPNIDEDEIDDEDTLCDQESEKYGFISKNDDPEERDNSDERFYIGQDEEVEQICTNLNANTKNQAKNKKKTMKPVNVPVQSNAAASESDPGTLKIRGIKLSLEIGWRHSIQRLLDINMERSPSQYETPR